MTTFSTDDGVRLSYVESGHPAGRPVVLIAGFRAAATSWVYQVPALENAGYRVVAFDRRSHGLSEKPEQGNTMARHGDDLDQLMTTLDLRDVVLVGGSQGGNVIWAYLDKHGTERVAGVVIADQTPRMKNSADWPHGFYGFDESNADTYFATGVPETHRHSLVSKGPVRIARLLKAMRPAAGSKPESELSPQDLELLHDHARADWRTTIAKTDIPALFIAGAQSEFWPSSHADAAAALAPRGRSLVIERAGHPVNIEQPKRFNAAMLEFIEGEQVR